MLAESCLAKKKGPHSPARMDRLGGEEGRTCPWEGTLQKQPLDARPHVCESLPVSQPRAPCYLLWRAFSYILDGGEGVILRALQMAHPVTTVGSLASEGLCPSALYSDLPLR